MTSNIMFLQGVFISDVEIKEADIWDISDDDISTCDSINELTQETIPQYYAGLETWPEQTSLRCWFCDCIFEKQRPITLPISMDSVRTEVDGTKVFRMNIIGYFHSWVCAQAYNKNQSPARLQDDRLNLLIRLYEDFNPGFTVTMIPTAEPRTVMKQWSGISGIDPEEYYQNCAKALTPYRIPKIKTVKYKFSE